MFGKENATGSKHEPVFVFGALKREQGTGYRE
jgi:hypothetical protein